MSRNLTKLCANHWGKYFRKLLYIIGCLIFLAPARPTEWWVTYYEDENTIHKCTRADYLEFTEQLGNTEINDNMDWNTYYCWEKDYLSIMSELPKRNYGQLKMIKENHQKRLANNKQRSH